MSKQALIDRAWQTRLQTYRAPTPPPARIPALRPEPGRKRAAGPGWPLIVGTALAAFAGTYAGAAIRRAHARPMTLDDDIDWLSGLG